MHSPNNHNSLSMLLTINMLYSFIVAALAVMVPLYLLDQKVDIAGIGLILAIGPFVFMLLRVTLASIADSIGTKIIGLLYSFFNLFSIAVYLVSTSAFGYSVATFLESVRTSAFWAITRTEIIAEIKSGGVLAYFSAMRQLGDALGRLAIGFLIAWFAFSKSFLIVGALSIVLIILVFLEKGGTVEKPGLDRGVFRRIFKKRPISFWHAAFLLALLYTPSNLLLAFLLPVYAHAGLGLGYAETGSMVAAFSIVMAFAMVLPSRWKFNIKTLLLLTALMIPALLALPFFKDGIIALVLVIAVGSGCSNLLGEYILADQVFRSRDVSTDIGMIFTPLKIAEIVFLSLGGFIISQWGYAPIFIFLAVCAALFVLLAKSLLHTPR